MSVKHIFYSGNGTTPVDSGLPHVGRFFTIEQNGDLRFFHYDGVGEQDLTGTMGFRPNTGNTIGNGFQNFLHVLGGGDGIILAIQPNGDLTFFQYTGSGEHDPTGDAGLRREQPGKRDRQRLSELPSRLRLAPPGPVYAPEDDDLRRRPERLTCSNSRPAATASRTPQERWALRGPTKETRSGTAFRTSARSWVSAPVPSSRSSRTATCSGSSTAATASRTPQERWASWGTTRQTRSATAFRTCVTSSAVRPTTAAAVAFSSRSRTTATCSISGTTATASRTPQENAGLREAQPRKPDRQGFLGSRNLQ